MGRPTLGSGSRMERLHRSWCLLGKAEFHSRHPLRLRHRPPLDVRAVHLGSPSAGITGGLRVRRAAGTLDGHDLVTVSLAEIPAPGDPFCDHLTTHVTHPEKCVPRTEQSVPRPRSTSGNQQTQTEENSAHPYRLAFTRCELKRSNRGPGNLRPNPNLPAACSGTLRGSSLRARETKHGSVRGRKAGPTATRKRLAFNRFRPGGWNICAPRDCSQTLWRGVHREHGTAPKDKFHSRPQTGWIRSPTGALLGPQAVLGANF